MEVHGAVSREQQQHDGGGVKVKFIETQFVSSDAASFKAVVQRLTGQSAPSPSPAPATAPRPNRPRARAAVTACPAGAAGWAGHGGGLMMAAPVKLEAAGAPPPNLEDLHELRDFSDLFYPTSTAGGGRRVDIGGYGYPY